MRRPQIAALLVGQAIAIAAWWVLLVVSPASRSYFHVHDDSLLAFWLADVAVIGVALAAAFAVWRGRPWARAALWLAAGGIAYGALYCVALWLATGAAWLAAAAMVPQAVIAVVLARSRIDA